MQNDDQTTDSNQIDHNIFQTPENQNDIKGPISWSANEFVSNSKSSNWYVLITISLIAIGVLVYFVVKSIFSVVAVAVMGIVFMIAAGRKPKTVSYELNQEGIHMGRKYYKYDDFKSFSVSSEGNMGAIILMPFKRFFPPVNVYFEHKDEDKIVSMLEDYLPKEESGKDRIDQFMKRIRF